MNNDHVEQVMARMERRMSLRASEALRVEQVRAQGSVPLDVGPEIPRAPARGPVKMFQTMASYPKGTNDFEVKDAGFMGRKTLRRADSFDLMEQRAARHKKPAPFNPTQVAIGRFYRDLVEKHATAGVKCSSIEGVSGGNGSGGSFMDAVLRDRQRIDGIRRRIGNGSALVVRRYRTSDRGSRVTIFDRRLVDIVCLDDGTISDVLKAHGWSIKADLIASLRMGLGQALDRMTGSVIMRGSVSAHFGEQGRSIWGGGR